MHARLAENNELDPLDVFCDLGTLIVEARVPGLGSNGRGYGEGPHCPLYFGHAHHNSSSSSSSSPAHHVCVPEKLHCQRFLSLRKHAFLLWQNGVPLCVEVLVGPECSHGLHRVKQAEITCTPDPDFLLLERWTVTHRPVKNVVSPNIASVCLVQAVRSFLHFSQLSAWLNKSSGSRPQQLLYRVTMPGQAFTSKFIATPVEHHFPVACVGHLATHAIKVSVSSLPRTDSIPRVPCGKCKSIKSKRNVTDVGRKLRYDLIGSLGEGLLDPPPPQFRLQMRSRSRSGSPSSLEPRCIVYPSIRGSVVDDRMRINCNQIGKHNCKCKEEENEEVSKVGEVAGQTDRWGHDLERGRTWERRRGSDRDRNPELPSERGRSRRSRKDTFVNACKMSDKNVQEEKASPTIKAEKNEEDSKDVLDVRKSEASVARTVPTSDDKLRFQRSLNSTASLVFHTTTNSKAKFLRSPPLRMSSAPLLGSFEESLLNGRLEPMSTVEGFRAELGASGSFCPSHELLPVSVFFYNFGGLESDKTASPYLAHLNLGQKGYQIPRRGTVQLTLFNPQGTVIKMFVILFDLAEMPPNSETFLRQRTYFMPANETDASPMAAKWLRYLIHLRFCSTKSGRIYLHTDIRMIVLRKSDVDTASAHIPESSHEWKSFTRGPSNPRFSSR